MTPHAYPTPMSQRFMDRANVYQPSNDPDQAAVETIDLMRTYIKDSARDPLVIAEAQRAVESYPAPLLALSGISNDDPRLPYEAREQAAAESCWLWAKHNLKFKHHSKLFAAWLPHFTNALQLLISPDVIAHALNSDDREARSRARLGDCAVFSPMICALLDSLGIDWELVIAAVDAREPDIFSHVWPRVVLSDGRRISLDASHGPYPGWQVPARDIHRLQVFSSSGRAVADEGSTFAGLGEYIATGLGDTDPFAGFDQTIDPRISGDYGAQSPYFNPTQEFGTFFPPASSGPSPWASVVGNLANQWTQIGGRVIAPQTTYQVGPHGEVSYSTPGAAPIPGVLPNVGSGSSLIWIGGGVAVLFALMAFGGKK